jgi:hypothetical protein
MNANPRKLSIRPPQEILVRHLLFDVIDAVVDICDPVPAPIFKSNEFTFCELMIDKLFFDKFLAPYARKTTCKILREKIDRETMVRAIYRPVTDNSTLWLIDGAQKIRFIHSKNNTEEMFNTMVNQCENRGRVTRTYDDINAGLLSTHVDIVSNLIVKFDKHFQF